ncbi:fumarylacetoacetase [Actinopolymorpha cephalotaxi]|uniref:fumarylacetoacetase n=1 Tax=Actinopolymorpha cephalotaxi TaxID=504797 RepID=A0A1I2KCV3_9ACTN|nr:fumarylacetoacetase [Actinopolymorpha cephalotaxi]NYH84404.1 fumarylacetoacetase [Actinopolymorpha cephalotaxi]SFF64178.1 fumarylacetoacetase [Actinopolymorpha cephalotaxi]
MATTSWVPVPAGSPFTVHNLPYGVFSLPDEDPRVGVAIGNHVLDLAPLAASEYADFAGVFTAPTLNPFMALGARAWHAVRHWVTERLTDEAFRSLVEPELVPADQVRLHLPFEVADYVDFYASEHHATRLGRLLRPNEPPLTPNWHHLPIGYHGRAGTVAVSGTPVTRPCGQHLAPGETSPSFGPSTRLDLEAEVGFVVGTPTVAGQRVSVDEVREYVFGVVLVNDWSARDLQAWEARPLGPFLGKSFRTSVSPWVVPLAALDAATVAPPAQDPAPLPHLRGTNDFGLDLDLEVSINDQVVARPRYADMYWTPAQMLAHLTSNGATLRTGDLLASGTVSGPGEGEYGCLMEASAGGTRPLTLADGSTRTFLRDDDVVTIRATAPAPGGGRLGLGEVTGQVRPATP